MSLLEKLASYFEIKYALREPEAPKTAPFGEYAWAKYREGCPEEPDTEIEKEVYRDLKKHFASKRIGLPKNTVKLLMSLLKVGYYKDVLHPPPTKTLYRGLKITNLEALTLLLGQPKEEIADSGKMDLNKSIENDNGFSTSWTAKKKITSDFSGNYGKAKKGYLITLVADVADNEHRFLAGPGGLYDVDGLSYWHLEKETVGLEPIIIKRIEWEKL